MSSSTDLYAHLGVSRSASGTDIKKAYFQLCKTHHPDRGGDPEQFKELKRAYTILSNEETREIYDNHGEDGLKRHEQGGSASGGMDLNDILSRAFGMGGGGGGGGERKPRGPPKGEDMQFRLRVSLPDLYNGKTQEIPIQRKEICSACSGSGSTQPGKVSTCSGCRGQGRRIVVRQMGPMMQQMAVMCPECNGEGKAIDSKFRCKTCTGQRCVVKETTVSAIIPAGSVDGESITLEGQSHQEPEGIPGDIHIQLKLHPTADCEFERHNDDLLYKRKITLTEAICGYRFNLTHMDGRVLTISSEPGSVVPPGGFQLVHDEGMPRKQNKALRGTLFIQFEIEFPSPSQISDALKAELTKIAPPQPLTDVHEEVFAIPFDSHRDPALGAVERGGATAHSDSGDDGGHQTHTCVHQ